MKKIQKRYVIVIVICGLILLLSFPMSNYFHILKIYYKFQSEINPQRDSILKKANKHNIYAPSTFDETSRLFYLCKIWGFIKYFQENQHRNMDSVLIALIPQVIQINNKNEYQFILKQLIEGGAYTQINKNPYPDINDYLLIDNEWIRDTVCLNKRITQGLDTIFYCHSGKENYFVYNKSIVGNIRFTNEPEYPEFSTEIVRLLGLFRYWNVINYFYVYKNCMDESWDKILYNAIPCFRAADTKEKYHQAIYALTNHLKDTHTSYPPTIDGVVFGSYRPNFRMMLIDSTYIINKIRIPEYDDGKFHIGDIVLKIDNQDIRALSDSLSAFVCGGNYWSNQSFLCNAVLSRRDSITLFMLLRDNDTLNIQSTNYKVYGMFQKERKMEKAMEKTQLYKWVNDSIAYFDLKSATSANFDKNYKPIRSASVIILDLRCYPSTDLILNLTDAFVPPNSFFAYATYPDTRFPGMVRYGKSSSDNIGSKDYFKGKIIVLVNEWTQSYSEYITMALQANPNTITVGNSSSGADGNVTTFEFPGGVKTIYSGIGIYYPDFTPTQRIGVKIDYVIEPTIKSIQNGRDMVLEKAVYLSQECYDEK